MTNRKNQQAARVLMEGIRRVHEKQSLASPDKRDLLIREAAREFTEHGYGRASTNRIVRRAGISKGILFHYFGTKERLYFELLDSAAGAIREAVEAGPEDLSSDPIDRIISLSRAEFRFYAARPDLYRLFRRAVSDPDMAKTVKDRYANSGLALFSESLRGARFAEGVNEGTAVTVLAWIVNGFNEAFLPSAKSTDDPEELMDRYETGLRRYLSLVAPCLCRSDSNCNLGGSA